MKAPVNTTLAVAFIAVCMLIGLEKMHESELVQVHQDGVAVGYKLGQADLTETMAKKVTDEKCHAWWFGGDTTRAAKSIQKVSFK